MKSHIKRKKTRWVKLMGRTDYLVMESEPGSEGSHSAIILCGEDKRVVGSSCVVTADHGVEVWRGEEGFITDHFA